MKTFKTSNGDVVTGKKLQKALNDVANDYIKLSHAIRAEDAYGDNITEQKKDEMLADGLMRAENIRKGQVTNFTVLQRLNTKLTGQCIAFLP